jgi:zinc protease
MIQRNIAPKIISLDKINFIEPKTFQLSDYSNCFWMKEVLDETVRIELQFDAGTTKGEKTLSQFVSSLLLSGTNLKKSNQIQEELDSLGAYTNIEIGLEVSIVSLFCLRKNAKEALNILVDAIQQVSFHESEVQDMLREKKQKFLINNEKVSVSARKEFQKHLFANSEVYSRQTEEKDFEFVSIEKLKAFHQKHYLNGLNKAVIVANFSDSEMIFFINSFKSMAKKEASSYETVIQNKAGRFHINKPNAVQTAIRMGIPLFNKTHPDFIDFQILETIFGDYFGSRLMSNIREDKGYTYGIGCGLPELRNTGYFVIVTEVGKDVSEATLKEIKFEMERLKNEPIPNEELELVKNYLLGQLLKSADGANAMMDLFLSTEMHGKKIFYYNEVIQHIKNINSKRINELATTYFDWDSFTICTVG